MNLAKNESPLPAAAPPPSQGTSRFWYLLLGGVVALGGAWLWFEFAPGSGPDLAEQARRDLDRRHFKPLSGPLEALLDDPGYQAVPTQTHPLLNRPAPDFTLADTDGKAWTLSEARRSGPVVLVFYYGYHCDHCVSQLFGLDKDLEKFREFGATVVAVSGDKPEITRERFRKFGAFHFPVLSDDDNQMATRYGTFVPPPKPGEEGELLHGTFVIDEKGNIIWANRGDAPFTENRTLLVTLNRQRKGGKRNEWLNRLALNPNPGD